MRGLSRSRRLSMTTKNESRKAKTPKTTSKLEVSKETLRDLTERNGVSAEVKGGKGGPMESNHSCDAGCE
jgi:hypothetical protein